VASHQRVSALFLPLAPPPRRLALACGVNAGALRARARLPPRALGLVLSGGVCLCVAMHAYERVPGNRYLTAVWVVGGLLWLLLVTLQFASYAYA
jgi:hypothetical protein